jgi:hypothetical protein
LGSGISYGKRVKLPVDSIPKLHAWLPTGTREHGEQNYGRDRPGGLYTIAVRGAKIEVRAEQAAENATQGKLGMGRIEIYDSGDRVVSALVNTE